MMPTTVDRSCLPGFVPGARPVEAAPDEVPPLEIGLINNASDAAFTKTQDQFAGLLRAACGGRRLRLHVFTLPGIPRQQSGASTVVTGCTPIEAIPLLGLHALVVTGAEPGAGALQDEPYWHALTGVIDWAETQAVPMVHSCLAVQAAVLHQDGVQRVRLKEKRFGLFAHETLGDHALLRGVPGRYLAAHSRHNEVTEAALRMAGYQILSRSDHAGVEIFVKQRNALSLYLQGHPEYDLDNLAAEYRRDVMRFMRGERAVYPNLPVGVFSAGSANALNAFRCDLERDAGGARTRPLPQMTLAYPGTTRPAHAVRLFTNWIEQVLSLKQPVTARV